VMKRTVYRDVWSRAARGWLSVSNHRRAAALGRLPPPQAALWSADCRRRRLRALVANDFYCDVCSAQIDPDQLYGVRAVGGKKAVPGCPSEDLRPICGRCRRELYPRREAMSVDAVVDGE
jgi:hypothetical protein